MKILNISLDPESGNPDSKVSLRFKDYGNLVERYDILTLGVEAKNYNLTGNVEVFVLKRKNKILDFFRISKATYKLLQNKKYDLVTVADPYFLGFKILKIARFFAVAIEIQVHGFEKLYGLRKIIAKFVLSHADSVRVVSERLKKQLVEEFRVQHEKITVVPVFVDTTLYSHNSEFAPIESGLKIHENLVSNPRKSIFTFLMVSRLVHVKSISFAIKAFQKVTEQNETELKIVGDGPEREKLENLVRELKLEQKVKFLGNQKDVGKFYREADAFLLTSEKEGWPLVVIEALSYGLPIIMTPVGQVGEILFDNDNVLVTPQGDIQTLVSLMEKIFTDISLRTKLQNRARETISKLPNKEEILKKYVESWSIAIKNKK